VRDSLSCKQGAVSIILGKTGRSGD